MPHPASSHGQESGIPVNPPAGRSSSPWHRRDSPVAEPGSARRSVGTTGAGDHPPTAELARDIALSIATKLGVPADVCCAACPRDPWGCWEARRPAGPPPSGDLQATRPRHGRRASDPLGEHGLIPGAARGWVIPLFADPGGQAAVRAGGCVAAISSHPRHLAARPASPARLTLAWTEGPDHLDVSPSPTARICLSRHPGSPATMLDLGTLPGPPWRSRSGRPPFVFLPDRRGRTRHRPRRRRRKQAAAVQASPWSSGLSTPGDPRLRTLSVTPDPGVIEVNVQPTRTWDELRDLTVDLWAGPSGSPDDGRIRPRRHPPAPVASTSPRQRQLADSPLLRLTCCAASPSGGTIPRSLLLPAGSSARRAGPPGRRGPLRDLYELGSPSRNSPARPRAGRRGPGGRAALARRPALPHLLTDLVGNTPPGRVLHR